MSKKKRKSRARKPAPKPPEASRAKKALNIALPVLAVAVLALVAYLVFFSNKPSIPTPSSPSPSGMAARAFDVPKYSRKAHTLNDLLDLPVEQLADVDIAEMNLLCATGLPGAEKLDIDKAFARLDDYAQRVRYWTDQSMWDFRQNPGKFENSEAKFRVLLLISVLQKDFGVHYNDRGERNCDFSSSKNPFIHGMIDDTNGGTCASMPVMYVAVGRRLGYPMSLVLAKTHTFCRWDAPNDRINIEGTNQGMNSFSDEYYLTWPDKVSEAEARHNRYLISLTPAEELASFLASRGHCLIDNGRTKEAFDAYAAANRLAPKHPAYLAWARDAQRRLQPPTFAGQGFREPPMVYRNDPMADIERINAINRANMRRMQPPMPGVPQPPMPPRQNLGLPQPYQPPVPGQPPRP